MKRRRPLLWLVAIGLLMLVAPPALLWLTAPRPVPALPIARFMPGRLSAALCLRQPRQAWDRHWTTRRGPAPKDALQAILEAMGTWPHWLKKYGEARSLARLMLYEGAFFHAFGEETWLVFGEWGGGAPGSGQAGLVGFIRSDTPVLSRVGLLMDLVFGERGYKIRSTQCEGQPAFEYIDKRLGRSLTFCQVGGWICVSLRRRDSGPLPAIVRQVKAQALGVAATSSTALSKGSIDSQSAIRNAQSPILNPQSAMLNLQSSISNPQSAIRNPQSSMFNPQSAIRNPQSSSTSTLAFAFAPDLFFDQLRLFTAQRGRKFSASSEQSLALWRRQLEGIDRITAAHAGDSLLDLDLTVEGRRARELSHLFAESLAASSTLNSKSPMGAFAVRNSQSAGSGELAQLDLALPLARLGAPLAGGTWKAALKSAKWLDPVAPGLRTQLERTLASGDPRDPGRIGLAAYPSPLLIPRMLFWVDRPPLAVTRHSPARVWSASSPIASFAGRGAGSDVCLWLASPAALLVGSTVAPPPGDGEWDAFTDRLWTQPPGPAQAFLTLNFHGVAAELEKIPTVLMKKAQRKKLDRWKSTVKALALGAGGAAARLDAPGDRLTLTLRTP